MNARLTGDPIPPRQVNPNVSPQVEELIMHAMARNPAERYPDARVMQVELNHPENIKVTGRAERAVKPVLSNSIWKGIRMYVYAASIPILVVLFFILKQHLHLKWQ
jgi:hypothetical protein